MQNRPTHRYIACALCLQLVTFGWSNEATAQGSRFDSFLNDAGRLLEQGGKVIERQLRDFTGPEATRKPHADITPPLPAMNPRRARTPPAATTPGPKAAAEPVAPAQSPQKHKHLPVPDPVSPQMADMPAPVHPPMPLPERNPRHRDAAKLPAHPSEIDIPDWTEEQIAQAKTRCEALLTGLVVDYSALDPIREGRCGTPYPIKVSSIGAGAQVKISPPATLTCAMTAALSRWLAGSLQPLTDEYLGSSAASLRNVSSYACRNRYNNANKRISEHALANALDIAAFVTQEGKTVSVLSHWRPKEAEDKSEVVTRKIDASSSNSGSAPPASDDIVNAHENLHQSGPLSPETVFLRFLHADACKTFGTVIGPEANEAHRNHFHFDMKKRKYGNYCE